MFLSRVVAVPLESGRSRTVFLLVALLCAGLVAAASIRVALPAQLSEASNLGAVQLAAKLDPSNDAIQHELGCREIVAGDFTAARTSLDRAIELNARHPEYWADLAGLCSVSGDVPCAAASYEQTIRLAPMRPQYSWDRAMYLAVIGHRDEALSELSRLMRISPKDASAAFDTGLRLYRDPNLVWNSVAKPAGTNVELTLLTFLAARGQGSETAPFWQQISGEPLPADQLRAYSEALVQHQQFLLAEQVWRALESREPAGPNARSNLIYNPDFTSKPTNQGFDWHLAPKQFVEVAAEPQDGRSALRMSFTVAHNDDSEPLYEFVPVQPSTSYALSADVKASDITSPSGPRLRVVDAECRQCLDLSSEPVLGTSDWRKLRVECTASPTTKVVRVSVARRRARAFPMDITGTVWFTGFDLEPAPSRANAISIVEMRK